MQFLCCTTILPYTRDRRLAKFAQVNAKQTVTDPQLLVRQHRTITSQEEGEACEDTSRNNTKTVHLAHINYKTGGSGRGVGAGRSSCLSGVATTEAGVDGI